MAQKIDPKKLLDGLIAKGTNEPLSESELATIFYLVEGERKTTTQSGPTTQDLKALKAEIETLSLSLQQERLEAQRVQQELGAVYNSTSWKMGAPLRKTLNKVKGHTESPRVHLKRMTDSPVDESLGQTSALIPIQPNYTPASDTPLTAHSPASLYAFYLPQFHPIAENSEWWGEGFTEWTNVKPAKPLFRGHYQPHKPDSHAELGYYDLRDSGVMRKQIELAQNYGVEGFCFYFYWFAGHRLLETPLLKLLDDASLEVPFCLCWANENWSRRWDGKDSEVLMAQNNTPDDDIAFISYISKYLKDPRYRRIDGKPILIVYRPIELPDAKATSERWRQWCRENGIGEIYLAYTQSFENNDPRDYGFDGAIEFPPNNSAPPDLTDQVEPLSPDFTGKAYDWDIFPKRSDNYQKPDYPLFRSVCPAWDNTARRKQNGTVFINSTPERYKHWLQNALIDSVERIPQTQDRLVFINAWNEWAEGAHLEPDAAYGYGYLEATRNALNEIAALRLDQSSAINSHKDKSKRIVVVSHDAYPHGAQYLSLNLAKTLKADYGYEVDLVTLGEGDLLDDFAQAATLHDLTGYAEDSPKARALAIRLFEQADFAICNTTVSGLFAAILKKTGFRVLSLIHELSDVIKDNGFELHAAAIGAHADDIVFPAQMVRNSFEGFTGPLDNKAIICPQGAYKRNRFDIATDKKETAHALRERLNLPKNVRIVLGVGYADLRKGYDLFITAAEHLATTYDHIVFVWIGHHDQALSQELEPRVSALIESGNLVLPGRVSDTDLYYAGADAYLLTSREDPYPSTVLEALDVGLPTIGFEGATGTVDLIKTHRGDIVPAFDIDSLIYATKKALVLGGPQMRQDVAARFRSRKDVSFTGYVGNLLRLAGKRPPSVSVVVPNYNYARYLPERIESIVAQTHPVSELVILDDASTDNSRDVISKVISTLNVPVQRLDNEQNSGSVFAQWLKGVKAATGDYVWIAEADDLALPSFLEIAMAGFRYPGVVLSYTQSKQMTTDGSILCDDYLDYVKGLDGEQWTQSYTRSGQEEIVKGMAVKNTIPNVSGVVFRRDILLSVLEEHMAHVQQYRVAGEVSGQRWKSKRRLILMS